MKGDVFMKINAEIQYAGNSFSYDEIIKKIKEEWVSKGNKVKDLDANVYIKLGENMVYYVVKEETYSVSL